MGIFSKISSIFTGKKELDAANVELLRDALIGADIAPDLAEQLVGKLRARGTVTESEAKQILFDAMLPIVGKLAGWPIANHLPVPGKSESPMVILISGVNGAGKTTSIGKLASFWKDMGHKVVIGAADTFRAAACEQLAEWADRAGADLITGTGDPASVAYKAVEHGIAVKADIVIIDTAGRLHNRADLMDELAKITRVIQKLDPGAPHVSTLVLDANTGQNALNQIEFFNKAAPLTGLMVTKMDSTAKGGFLVSYAANNKIPLPVYGIGYGEKLHDLRPFSADEYLHKLLGM
ncbi:MAG: signal recognition particle-docking protein FtsY [Alphaproteobacteria bacterium]|nr:signal recognition particle-docking protein FtsY [Alphaproteobacteria bacterium]MCL2889922.1 signal recognition particle-docking protein FtsY [Alphaproteobacteria bacterium]